MGDINNNIHIDWNTDKILFTTQDLVSMLSMCKRIILDAVKVGELKCIKYGSKFYFTKEQITDFINLISSYDEGEE